MKTKLISFSILLAASFNVFAQDAAEDLNGPTVVCVGALAGEPRLSALAGKVDVAPIPFARMERTPERVATADERKLIALWVSRRDACFQAGAEYRVKTLLPEEQAYATALFAVQRELALELIRGRVTYAQYNSNRFDTFKAAQYEAGFPAAAAAW
jgi:hypothetical protein